jgi:predicted RNA methylase
LFKLEGRKLAQIEWLKLWSELTTANSQIKSENNMLRYQAHARKRVERPDTLLDFVITLMDSEDTVVEIGPGNGRWTIPVARKVKRVTAVEPGLDMAKILSENIQIADLHNVKIMQEVWEKADPGKHDFCLCAHAMYNSADLEKFVRKMEYHANKLCALSIRIPPADGVLSELSEVIYGNRHDSTDTVIAYNALYDLGIYANVKVEEEIVNWTNETFEEAFRRAKRHLRVEENPQFDKQIRSTLQRKLSFSDGLYKWPDGMRSALLYWRPRKG